MWLSGWLKGVCERVFVEAFCENYVVLIAFLSACVALLVAATIGYRTQNTGVYLGLAALIGGGACIASLTQTLTVRAGVLLAASFAVFGGATYVVLWGVLTIKQRIRLRRKEREEIQRKLKFTLPERENSFVQARLNTTLQVGEGAPEEEETEALPLSHAWKLLSRLREKPLSAADRLTAAELAAFVSAYREKPALTRSDLHALNDALAGILKLSAKYSV